MGSVVSAVDDDDSVEEATSEDVSLVVLLSVEVGDSVVDVLQSVEEEDSWRP